MKPRSPAVVFLLSLITFGLYPLYWFVATKNEMNRAYATKIPTAWLLLVPFIGAVYWLWHWCEGAGVATRSSAALTFVMMITPLSIIAIPLMASKFNAARPVTASSGPLGVVSRAA